MKFGKTSNPALNEKIFNDPLFANVQDASKVMTVQGAVNKVGLMLLIILVSATITWKMAAGGSSLTMPLMILGIIGGLITAIVTIVKKQYAPVSAPLYAAFEGLFLGGISALFNHLYNGIVVQAVLLTFGIMFGLLVAYKTGLVKATERFKKGVMAATFGVAMMYLLTFILGLFGIELPFIHDGGGISIFISLVIVVIAALNLVLDFDFIEQGALARAPKFMEWYGAFGLMVTLIWLYLELLRLLSMLNRN